MAFTIRIPGRTPGLNELLNSKATTSGKWNGYNAIKCQCLTGSGTPTTSWPVA
jgi:hypothetical protein